jgi:dienelactone hydrolase
MRSLQGLDWHGPSTQEAWGTVSALSDILQANDAWKNQAFPIDSKVVLIGHSNGGQGVWHMATHFPDRVAAGEYSSSLRCSSHKADLSKKHSCSCCSLYQVSSIHTVNTRKVTWI